MAERIVDRMVTYTLEHGGKLVVVEHVPARVCVETDRKQTGVKWPNIAVSD